MMMKRARMQHLERIGGHLTLAELRDGWHFCPEFDEGLTQGEQLDEHGRCAWCGFDKRRVPPGQSRAEIIQQQLLALLVERLKQRLRRLGW
jgi:hypothetical protein